MVCGAKEEVVEDFEVATRIDVVDFVVEGSGCTSSAMCWSEFESECGCDFDSTS